MNKDSYLIFEAYKNRSINESMPYPEFAKLSKHAASKLPEDKPKEKLKYTYEIVAYLPRDIDISTREGQDKVLSLAHKELVKRVTNKYKNPERAASNMFYDEDFPMEIVSQYAHYQKHGFPEVDESEESCIKDLASKHNVSLEDIAKQLEMGLKVETEHTDNKDVARKIAMDHLAEDPHYYTKLAKMEKNEDAEGTPLTPYKQKLKDNELKKQKNNESMWMSNLMKFFYGDNKKRIEALGDNPYEEWVKWFSPFWDERVISKFAEIYNNTWGKNPENSIDINLFLKVLRNKKEEREKADTQNSEDEERRLDPKCWKGYHKAGTKLKSGVRVNNCVKNS